MCPSLTTINIIKMKKSPKSLAIMSVIDRHAHERLIYNFYIKLTPFKHFISPICITYTLGSIIFLLFSCLESIIFHFKWIPPRYHKLYSPFYSKDIMCNYNHLTRKNIIIRNVIIMCINNKFFFNRNKFKE